MKTYFIDNNNIETSELRKDGICLEPGKAKLAQSLFKYFLMSIFLG